MTLPTGIRGRLVALALLCIPAILIVNYLLLPLATSYASNSAELDEMRADISRYQRLIKHRPTLQDAVARLDQAKPLKDFLLAGRNQALAAAKLQRLLQSGAERSNTTILSLRVKNSVIEGDLVRIPVEARLRADTKALRDLLYFVETNKPYIFVDQLGINARQTRRRAVSNAKLDVRLNLYGLYAPSIEAGTGVGNG
jgi:general secretion pathway protein M